MLVRVCMVGCCVGGVWGVGLLRIRLVVFLLIMIVGVLVLLVISVGMIDVLVICRFCRLCMCNWLLIIVSWLWFIL